MTDASSVTVITTGEDGTWSATVRARNVEVEYLDLPDGYEAPHVHAARFECGRNRYVRSDG